MPATVRRHTIDIAGLDVPVVDVTCAQVPAQTDRASGYVRLGA